MRKNWKNNDIHCWSKGTTVQNKENVINLLFQDKMQLMRQFFTQEYGLFLVCLLLFLSNTTRGNSSNDPTGFPNEGIDYFTLGFPHNQVSTNQKFILLKDNTSGKTSNFHKHGTSSDISIPHHINLQTGTAQYKNHFNPEAMNNLEDADNNKEELNKDIWEMKSFPSSGLQNRQVCLNECEWMNSSTIEMSLRNIDNRDSNL